MELKELKIEEIKSTPCFTEKVTIDGKLCHGQFIVEGCLLNFELGLLSNDIWDDDQIFPAIQGKGFYEYRENGILTDPGESEFARYLNGFKEKESWKDGKFIKKEKNN